MSHIFLTNQGGVPSHSGLTGLLLDDHPQYRLTASTAQITATTVITSGVQFDVSYTQPEHVPGLLHWNVDDECLEIDCPPSTGPDPDSVHLQLGQENYIRGRNNTGAPVENGKLVYIDGSNGTRATFKYSQANSSATSRVCAITTHAMDTNEIGYITTFGLVRGLNTNSYLEGDSLYLSPTVPGGMTNVKPSAPNYRIKVGVVIKKAGIPDGSILFKPMDPATSHDLADFNGTPADATNKYLVWQPEGYFDADVIYHSGLTGLQGGQSGQHYHLDESNYTNLTGMTYANFEPTGFINTNKDSILSFTEANRTFSITPTGDTFDVMVNGKLFRKGLETVQISDEFGLHHVAYTPEGNLVTLGTEASPYDFIFNNAYVANIFWDHITSAVTGVGDERHGVTMDPATHLYLHTTVGSVYRSGLGPFGITLSSDGNNDQSAVVGVGAGVFYDEDVIHSIPLTDTGATIPVVYMSGETGRWLAATPRIHPVLTGTGGYVAYNRYNGSSWELTPVPATDFCLYHIFATNGVDRNIISIPGQSYYSTAGLAQAAANDEISTLVLENLPMAEFIPIATIIYETKASYGNQSKSIIIPTDTGAPFIDWRNSSVSSAAGGAYDHGLLVGLSDDDHPQYQTSARTETQITGISHASISATSYSGIGYTKAMTILDTRADENIPMFFTQRALNFNMTAVVLSGSSPSVTWWLRHDTNKAATGTLINSATTTNTTNGGIDTSMISSSVPANSWVWMQTTATGGTVAWMNLTVGYREV